MNKYQVQDKLFNIYCGMYFLSMWMFDRKSAWGKRKYQNKRLKNLLKRAYKLPIYKEKFDAANVSPDDFHTVGDLVKFPTLSKEEYRRWMNEELEKPETQYLKKTYTSGSTGIPTTNIYPPNEYAHHYMADFYGWMRGGYNPFFGKSLTRQPGDGSVGMQSFIQRLGLLRRECFNTQWDRQKIVDKINEEKADFILANSSELVYIAQYILDHNLSVHKPKYFCPTGEHIDGRIEQILKTVYGDGLINIYGGTEMADFAVRRPGETIYEIIEDLAAVCIKDSAGQLLSKGEGSLLVTPLFRVRYPLINYEIGDIVELGELDGCDYLFKISGRKNDVFYWENGQQTIYKNLENVNMRLKDIYQIRFVQNTIHEVCIQAVKDKKSEKTLKELEEYLRNSYREQFPAGVLIKVEWFDTFMPEKNGKIRNMISNIGDSAMQGDRL